VATAFTELGVRRITAGCFADNLASVRILEGLGMRREQHGVEDSWHEELGWIDGYTYGLLASEWRAA
jgi:RimJ/RimL family protein N-acetyltransferase